MSLSIPVIDNGGQWTHREWRVLRDLEVDTVILPNTTPWEELDCDGLVLSGGSPRIGLDASGMGATADYLENLEVPILGICAGHQFLSNHFAGATRPAVTPEFGLARLEVISDHPLFAGLPRTFEVWESHNDEVAEVGPEVMVLARSDDCPVQAVAHRSQPIMGVQFHPEVSHTEHGEAIFENFLGLCKH